MEVTPVVFLDCEKRTRILMIEPEFLWENLHSDDQTWIPKGEPSPVLMIEPEFQWENLRSDGRTWILKREPEIGWENLDFNGRTLDLIRT